MYGSSHDNRRLAVVCIASLALKGNLASLLSHGNLRKVFASNRLGPEPTRIGASCQLRSWQDDVRWCPKYLKKGHRTPANPANPASKPTHLPMLRYISIGITGKHALTGILERPTANESRHGTQPPGPASPEATASQPADSQWLMDSMECWSLDLAVAAYGLSTTNACKSIRLSALATRPRRRASAPAMNTRRVGMAYKTPV